LSKSSAQTRNAAIGSVGARGQTACGASRDTHWHGQQAVGAARKTCKAWKTAIHARETLVVHRKRVYPFVDAEVAAVPRHAEARELSGASLACAAPVSVLIEASTLVSKLENT
jgi:hypothetical protein